MYIKENLYQEYTLLNTSLGKLKSKIEKSILKQDELQLKVRELHDQLHRDQLQLNEYEEFYSRLAQSLNLEDAENYMMYRVAHQQLECEAIKCKDEIDGAIQETTSLMGKVGKLKVNALMLQSRIDKIREISIHERRKAF